VLSLEDIRSRPWPDIWDIVADAAAVECAELRREVGPGHVLHGVRCRLVATTPACDDRVYELIDSGHVALVHMTWSAPCPDPRVPWTTLWRSLDDWFADGRPCDAMPTPWWETGEGTSLALPAGTDVGLVRRGARGRGLWGRIRRALGWTGHGRD
jgi:hypothetical protein